MTIPTYDENYLREVYVELGYSELIPYYEFIDRVRNGQLDIPMERVDKQ